MTKLKTLNDFGKEPGYKKDVVFKCLLRAEAVKWVNGMNDKEPWKIHQMCNLDSDVIDWIMYFFNISEEDLK